MPQSFSSLRINPDRMKDAFDQLAAIGSTEDGGVNRTTFSEAHLAAREWFREHIRQSGLELRVDGAGNHSAFLPCDDPIAPTLILGSHLDSVPKGGRFDGALGVMAALEALKTIRENGIRLKVQLEAMDFTDEEGTHLSLFGSSAFSGHLHPEALQNPYSGRENFKAGLAYAGLTEESLFTARRPKGSLAGYIELHIEQGKRLEKRGLNIGIVSAIVGYGSYRMAYIGRADHAGSSAMEDRLDAGQGVAAFILEVRQTVMRDFPNCVANVGKIEFSPGASNIVPARADFLLEFRSPDEKQLGELDQALIKLAKEKAEQFGLQVSAEALGRHTPNPMSAEIQMAFQSACDGLELSSAVIPSGAIHDAQSLVDVCPVGMIFVPSLNGTSHSPFEFTEWRDCVNGANVLLQAALILGSG
ncbi:MAG TPA: Zn-dependent hydrolase [Anaerolineales bacterium]|nr:Zn-dependent hydrolase [Anaerolineales bacterium]